MSAAGQPTGPADEEERPWERAGKLRRDCEPHRGNLLLWLGVAALFFGLLSVFLVVPGFIAVVLAIVADSLACRDLRRMRAGLMDPAGEGPARTARRYATAGLLTMLGGWGLCCAGFILWIAVAAP